MRTWSQNKRTYLQTNRCFKQIITAKVSLISKERKLTPPGGERVDYFQAEANFCGAE